MAFRRKDPEFPFDAGRFTDSALERLGPHRTVLRMNALAEPFERRDSSFGSKPYKRECSSEEWVIVDSPVAPSKSGRAGMR